MQDLYFDGLGKFAQFVRRMPMAVFVADVAGRGAVGELLTREVKARIGDPDRLPPPLAASTVAERVRLGFSANETLLRTGHLRESLSWGHVAPDMTIVGSTDRIAPFHELGGKAKGHSNPPKRSFLAATMQERNDMAFGLYCAILTNHIQSHAVRGSL